MLPLHIKSSHARAAEVGVGVVDEDDWYGGGVADGEELARGKARVKRMVQVHFRPPTQPQPNLPA